MSPRFLPDGRTLLFAVERAERQDVVAYSDAAGRRVLDLPADWVMAVYGYAPTGHLLYRQILPSDRIPLLWAVPFNLEMLTVTGEQFLMAANSFGGSVSSDGTLVYGSVPSVVQNEGQLVWVDRSGQVQGRMGQPRENMQWPALSPDDRQVAVSASEQGNLDVWVYDITSGIDRRLTSYEGVDFMPAWSPDGTEVVFTSFRESPDLFRRRSDGSGSVRPVVVARDQQIHPFWSRDGRYVIYTNLVATWDSADLWAVDLKGDQEPFALFEAEHGEIRPTLSPDGRYVAYSSTPQLSSAVYVRSFPSGEGQWLVGAGNGPTWNDDGTELFFVSGDSLMVVEVSTRGVFSHGIPKALFTAKALGANYLGLNYDVSGDGQRFVVVQTVREAESATSSITVVQNWIREFEVRE